MKKLLVLFAFGFLCTSLMASLDPDVPPPKVPTREPTPVQGFPIDDATLRGQIFDLLDDIWLNIETNEGFLDGIKSIAKDGGVTPERMTKMLESIVREGLRDMKTAKKGSTEYSAATAKLDEPVLMLRVFHGPDTLALLRECALAKDNRGTVEALKTYIHIAGAVEAMPLVWEVFIGEIVEKRGSDLNPLRRGVYTSLQQVAEKLRREGKGDDFNKVYIGLMGMAKVECEPNAAYLLDQILCSGHPDYATSIDREKAIEKFLDMRLNLDYFKNIKTEVTKIPANKRRDYNKQPLRVPKESEKEIKIMLPAY